MLGLAEIVERARAAGLSGAAVCDHDLALTDPPVFPDFLLIPGVEVSTEYGHLLGLFVTGPVKAWSLRQAVDIIHGQGGLAVLAHPFERSRDAARLEPIVPLLDGAEVWNGRADRKIRQANALSRPLPAPMASGPSPEATPICPRRLGTASPLWRRRH